MNVYVFIFSIYLIFVVGGHDNSLILAVSADGIMRMWDLRSDFSHPCRKMQGHKDAISSVHWNVSFVKCSVAMYL